MAKRVLVVLEAGDAYPSGSVRGLIYREYFRHRDFDVKYVSRLFPPLVQLLAAPPRFLSPLTRPLALLGHAGARVMEHYILQLAKRYDVIYMSKVSSFRLISKLRRETKARLVLDFGDALWLPQRNIYRFNDTLALVDAVTTDNHITADYIRRFNPNCFVIPDCPQVEWFDQARSAGRRGRSGTVVLGWIGTPGTVYNLYVVWEALERIFSRYCDLHLRLVGVGSDHTRLPPFERVTYSCRPSYSQSEMIEEVLRMDIGLFPLQDVEVSRARGVLKATIYMAGEVAVVCSPVGECADLIHDGVNGLLARSTDEWEEKLQLLITNPGLRHHIAQAGLQTVRSRFTVRQSFSQLCAVLDPETASPLAVERK